jgi:hypothetical protein
VLGLLRELKPALGHVDQYGSTFSVTHAVCEPEAFCGKAAILSRHYSFPARETLKFAQHERHSMLGEAIRFRENRTVSWVLLGRPKLRGAARSGSSVGWLKRLDWEVWVGRDDIRRVSLWPGSGRCGTTLSREHQSKQGRYRRSDGKIDDEIAHWKSPLIIRRAICPTDPATRITTLGLKYL